MSTPDPREALRELVTCAANYRMDPERWDERLALAVVNGEKALAQAAPPPVHHHDYGAAIIPCSQDHGAAPPPETEWRCSTCMNEHDEFSPHDNEAAPPPVTVTVDHNGSDRPVDGFGIVDAQAARPPVHHHDYGATVIPCSQDHGAAPPSGLDVEGLGYQQRPRWWDRGAWTHYTTHQVACAVPPWAGNSEATCTCGYTHLVNNALRDKAAEYAALAPTPDAS